MNLSSRPALTRFRDAFRGEVIVPGDDTYHAARRIWNARYDRRPAAIARPADSQAVAAAVRFSREQSLEIAIRCGGHSPLGDSTTDGGLVIDLSLMRGVDVDPQTRRARVLGGTLLKELDAAGQEHGLVCPVGVVGHTGVGGLTLGGGMGRLQRKHGLALDNLRAVEVVTSDGTLVRAGDEDEPDLFWAMRGAGHNFGVVTMFEFELQPFGGTLHRSISLYPMAAAHEVWEMVDAAADGLSEDIGLVFSLGRAEPAADYPEAIAGKPIVVVGINHCGDADAVAPALAFLEGGPAPAIRTDADVRYLDIQVANDDRWGWGNRSYVTSRMINGLRRETLDALVEHAERAPIGECVVGASLMGGAVARVPDAATAFPGRGARWDLSAMCDDWEDPTIDASVIDWCNGAMAIVAPDAVEGRYVNEIGESGSGVARSIYGDARYARLAQLKRRWDPDNVFHLNQNIEPA